MIKTGKECHGIYAMTQEAKQRQKGTWILQSSFRSCLWQWKDHLLYLHPKGSTYHAPKQQPNDQDFKDWLFSDAQDPNYKRQEEVVSPTDLLEYLNKSQL